MERTYIKDVTPGVCRVSGFVENFRNKRTMAFIVVKDITGKLQVTIEKEKHPEFEEMLNWHTNYFCIFLYYCICPFINSIYISISIIT